MRKGNEMKICVRKKEPKIYALIDNEDFDLLSKYCWWVTRNNYIQGCKRPSTIKGKMIYLHRLIMNIPKGKYIDHINHNPLDNRKSNLRICNITQNKMNSKKYKNGCSKYKGVCWHIRIKKWQASISKNNKRYHIGYFDSEIEAARAYNKAAKELFSDFAYLNKIESK
jgi:hypothetical protein